ncbi:hypothetical protein Hanom_Chr07g00604011 [Helianthus anomalus]
MTFFSGWGHRSTPFDACITSKVGVGQLTSLLFETGLNIQEAHAFSSVGGFLLDVFVGRLIVVKILHPLNAKVFQHQVTLCPQMIM